MSFVISGFTTVFSLFHLCLNRNSNRHFSRNATPGSTPSYGICIIYICILVNTFKSINNCKTPAKFFGCKVSTRISHEYNVTWLLWIYGKVGNLIKKYGEPFTMIASYISVSPHFWRRKILIQLALSLANCNQAMITFVQTSIRMRGWHCISRFLIRRYSLNGVATYALQV